MRSVVSHFGECHLLYLFRVCVSLDFSSFQTQSIYFKHKTGILSRKTRLAQFILLLPHCYILKIDFTSFKTHFESMPNKLYKICANSNAAECLDSFKKIVLLKYLLSGRSHNPVSISEAASQIIFVHLNLLTPKRHCLVSTSASPSPQFCTFHTLSQMFRPSHIPNLSRTYTAKGIFLTLSVPYKTNLK